MGKSARAVSVISGADGPTAVFVAGRKTKLTLKQKMHRFTHKIKRKFVEKTIKPGSHTIDEVIEYIKSVHGFVEVDKNCREFKEEYEQMQHADIDVHLFKKNENVCISVEKKSAYIGGGASGKKEVKEFERIYKDIYRYYGVTQEDISTKSDRYKDYVRVLSQ